MARLSNSKAVLAYLAKYPGQEFCVGQLCAQPNFKVRKIDRNAMNKVLTRFCGLNLVKKIPLATKAKWAYTIADVTAAFAYIKNRDNERDNENGEIILPDIDTRVAESDTKKHAGSKHEISPDAKISIQTYDTRGKTKTSGSKGDKRKGQKSVPNRGAAPAGRPHDTAGEKLVRYLADHPDMEYQPKTIAREIKESHDAVKKAIQREMEKDVPSIVQVHRGWYRTILNADRLKLIGNARRIGLHGIKLEGRLCPQMNTGYSLPGASRYYRKRRTYQDVFEARKVTITVHENGLVEVWLNTSKVPLTFEEFNGFCYWLNGRFATGVDESSWMVVELGVNVDFYEMQLDGLKSLKLRAWRNAWFQIYQKEKDMVRVEVHELPQMELKDCMAVMSSFAETVRNMARAPDSQVFVAEPASPKRGLKPEYDPSYN